MNDHIIYIMTIYIYYYYYRARSLSQNGGPNVLKMFNLMDNQMTVVTFFTPH